VLRTRNALLRAADRLLPPESAVFLAAGGLGATQVLATFAELGLPDAIGDDAKTADELARELGLDADALHRLLRALATREIVRMDRRGRFRLARMGQVLRADHPQSIRPFVLYFNSRASREAWAGLTDTVRTGEPSFPTVHGRSVWEHFAANPDEEALFAETMQRLTEMVLPSIVAGYPWPESGSVCDVGGGNGTLLAGILRARPRLRGVLVDAPGVLREAEARLERDGLADRVELSPGDIFERVEARADVYALKDVLHDWDDARCVEILRTVRRPMPSGAKVVLVETLQERNVPDAIASMIDLQMLTQCDGGRQRSVEELHALLRAADLRPGAVHHTAGPSLVEGVA
jgi:O-methyltransferase domain